MTSQAALNSLQTMKAPETELERQVLQLPPRQRARLAVTLWNSLSDDDDWPELSPEWEVEIQRRVTDVDTGRVALLSGEAVFAEARARVAAVRG